MADDILKPKSHRFKDLTGQIYGRLTVVEFVDVVRYAKGSRARWLCACSCGSQRIVFSFALTTGHTQSCGCHRRETTAARSLKHGSASRAYKSREYIVWCGMHSRCNATSGDSYVKYSSKGIKVHPLFDDFTYFLNYMGPSEGRTLDRIDGSKGYEPGNVRWATYVEQAVNRKTTRFVIYGGERMCLKHALKLARKSIRICTRLRKSGMSPQEAFDQTPVSSFD